jgi:hypothetical protein
LLGLVDIVGGDRFRNKGVTPMQATFTRKSQFPVFLLALALVGALMLGGAGGYLVKSLAAQSTITVPRGLTVAPSGPKSAVLAVDPLTGYSSGSVEDQRILAILKRSGYEGGGTVVQGGSPRP